MIQVAIEFARKGHSVFPCVAKDKKPLTANGFKDASNDPAVVADWWTRYPQANIGMPTGAASGLVVLDVDIDPTVGKNGEQTLAALLKGREPLPQTLEVKTPRGGRHIYFKNPNYRIPCSTGKLGPGLDVRGEGGYVLLPPSKTKYGRYEYLKRVPIAELPGWLKDLMVAAGGAAHSLDARAPSAVPGIPPTVARELESGAPQGERNDRAFKVAVLLRDEGHSEEEAFSRVLEFARKCNPPLPEPEARAVVRSAFKSPPRGLARNPERREPRPVVSADFTAYYDFARKCYWTTNARGEFIEITETSARRYLKDAGYCPRAPLDAYISDLDKKLIEIQRECDVAFAGPLAGHPKGLEEFSGRRILVTESPRFVQPVPGEWLLISALIVGLFEDPVRDQCPYVLGWLKIAIEALMAGQIRPGQILVIAGPRDSGKSLFQNLCTEMLGGRAAKPFRYMSGATPFNGELFGAEHLLIEDEIATNDIRSRRHLGARMKDFTVNEVQSHHAKHRQAISLKPFWRVSMTLNNEPENVLILPPLDDSLADKIMLLKAHKRPMPMSTQSLSQRKDFWAALCRELPAFVHHLLNWQIPEALRSERFGVTHYHHPDLLAALDELSPELRLLALIDSELFDSPAPAPWEGTADQLERALRASSIGGEVSRLLTFNTACGVFLGRLHHKIPNRIKKHRDAAKRAWTILPPSFA
jgi:hypothetical protein